MKQSLYSILVALGGVTASYGATLTFSNAGTSVYATGFGDTASNIASGLIWGVIVDTTGNGFATTNWNSGFTYTGGNTTGIVLQALTGGATDDVLYINTSLTSSLAAAADGATAGSGRVNSITSVTYGTNGVAGGQRFGIVWFDRGIALNSASQGGQKFGFIPAGTVAAPTFALPPANSDVIDFSPAFLGADPVKSTSLVLGIPEPSAALLGAIGALGLLRRRRI